jgi:hypothetical protein
VPITPIERDLNKRADGLRIAGATIRAVCATDREHGERTDLFLSRALGEMRHRRGRNQGDRELPGTPLAPRKPAQARGAQARTPG